MKTSYLIIWQSQSAYDKSDHRSAIDVIFEDNYTASDKMNAINSELWKVEAPQLPIIKAIFKL